MIHSFHLSTALLIAFSSIAGIALGYARKSSIWILEYLTKPFTKLLVFESTGGSNGWQHHADAVSWANSILEPKNSSKLILVVGSPSSNILELKLNKYDLKPSSSNSVYFTKWRKRYLIISFKNKNNDNRGNFLTVFLTKL